MKCIPPSIQTLPVFPIYQAAAVFRRPGAIVPAVERLFVRGDLSFGIAQPRLGIVGSRSASVESRRWAHDLAAEAAANAVVVVSGGARGIDSESHRGAMNGGGITWWVSGTSVDRVYPAEHKGLLRELLSKNGAMLSEIPPGGRSGKHFFRLRNRLIAGLSDILVVVAAGAKSGTLSTIDYALEQGVPVFVPPEGEVPETEGVALMRRQRKIRPLSRENLFTELSKRGRNCTARERS